jgi:uncharacterized protein DUF2612
MASQQLLDELIDYYTNLLIIQYNSLPKASATIELFISEALANGITFDVQNAYNLIASTDDNWDSGGTWDSGEDWDSGTEGIAVGKQLDVIGKYVGVNRFYTAIDLENYFALITASEVSMLPNSPPAFGLSTAATIGNFDYNGTLVCNDIVTSQNALSDADFLTLIQFMILCNNMNYSAAAIDNALYQIFGTTLRAESTGNMTIVFFIMGVVSTLINTIIFKGLLPVPEGVGFLIVENINGLMFGMVTARGTASAYAYGFSTCADYATLSGQTLTCTQIS